MIIPPDNPAASEHRVQSAILRVSKRCASLIVARFNDYFPQIIILQNDDRFLIMKRYMWFHVMWGLLASIAHLGSMHTCTTRNESAENTLVCAFCMCTRARHSQNEPRQRSDEDQGARGTRKRERDFYSTERTGSAIGKKRARAARATRVCHVCPYAEV